jgi:hypothetical protein
MNCQSAQPHRAEKVDGVVRRTQVSPHASTTTMQHPRDQQVQHGETCRCPEVPTGHAQVGDQFRNVVRLPAMIPHEADDRAIHRLHHDRRGQKHQEQQRENPPPAHETGRALRQRWARPCRDRQFKFVHARIVKTCHFGNITFALLSRCLCAGRDRSSRCVIVPARTVATGTQRAARRRSAAFDCNAVKTARRNCHAVQPSGVVAGNSDRAVSRSDPRKIGIFRTSSAMMIPSTYPTSTSPR